MERTGPCPLLPPPLAAMPTPAGALSPSPGPGSSHAIWIPGQVLQLTQCGRSQLMSPSGPGCPCWHNVSHGLDSPTCLLTTPPMSVLRRRLKAKLSLWPEPQQWPGDGPFPLEHVC